MCQMFDYPPEASYCDFHLKVRGSLVSTGTLVVLLPRPCVPGIGWGKPWGSGSRGTIPFPPLGPTQATVPVAQQGPG